MRMDQLQSATPDERARVKEQFIAGLRDELDGLLNFLRGKDEQLARKKRIDPSSAEFHAVEILQFARYSPAADLFVRQLDTRRTDFPVVSDEFQAFFRFFPFAVAASAVGMPAVPALTKELGVADVATTQFQLSCLVLKEILGEELALAQLAIAAKTDAGIRDAQRQEQASQFIQMKTADWEATLCSDYAID
jgi:hypothetical protein